MLEDEEAVERLEHDLRRLKIDRDRFLTGNLKSPPEQLRQSINTQIHQLQSRHIRSFAIRFRLNNQEARFNTLSVLFGRRLRELEQGELPAAAQSARLGLDASDGVVLGESPEAEAVEVLYQELCRAREVAPATDLGEFLDYLAKQVAQIRSKTGCDRVRFRVASEGVKVKLKAKPVFSS